MMRSLIVCLLLFVSVNVLADPPIRDSRIINPKRNVGYVVGDIFKRTLELEVAAPYTLSRTSLPAEGVSQAGMELRKVEVDEQRLSETTRYRIEMTYQVFAHNRTASKIKLPTQILQVTANGTSQKVSVPGWSLRISPLATDGETDIEKDMSPYRAPLLVETGYLKPALGLFLALVLFSVLGLIYINGDKAWFPGMGGPFAASYRRISTIGNSTGDLNKAIISMQNAFNATFEENLFGHDVDRFVQKHPNFMKLRDDIETFFDLSNHVLFGVQGPPPSKPTLVEFLAQYQASAASSDKAIHTFEQLVELCRACRDCERGVA